MLNVYHTFSDGAIDMTEVKGTNRAEATEMFNATTTCCMITFINIYRDADDKSLQH